ncbi:PIG-L family deacetylase [candidate division KSB1 bacterium]|nr:PIG-L family deacetylase [candidate division KSB1 bacterium]
MKRYFSIPSFLFIYTFFITFSVHSQSAETENAGELQTALHKLNVLGSVLYIAAHPDDENTGLLAYLSKGRKYRTEYLSLTRGDGGQNLIGAEKGAEIGILRTQELLEARKFDKAEQYFTRAIDFGYSKTARETFDFWGREQILSDIVWVIRTFRPDVIITRFTPDGDSGHGHHTASALLAEEAFTAAADPEKFPEHLKYVTPWRCKRIFWNNWRPGRDDTGYLLNVDIGEYNPLLGKSYSEVAALSRSKHKSQGFGAVGQRGRRLEYFELIAGEPAKTDILEGVNTTWNRVPGGQKIAPMLSAILSSFDSRNPSASIPALLAVYKELEKPGNNYWVEIKKQELLGIIRSCAGLWMEAITDDYAVAPGDEIQMQVTLVNRSDFPFKLNQITIEATNSDSIVNLFLKNNESVTITKMIRVPADFPISQPYWLQKTPQTGLFTIKEQNLIGLAENPPAIPVTVTLRFNGQTLIYTIPVLYRWRDRAAGELYRPLEIRPPVTVNPEDKVSIFPDNQSRTLKIRVKSHSRDITGMLSLVGPEEWEIVPAGIPFTLKNKYEEKIFTFTVSPPKEQVTALLTAAAEINGQKFDKALVEISYPHISTQVFFPESQVKVVKLDIKRNGKMLGYITGSGDEIPGVLRNIGYDVVLLDDTMLENDDLSNYDAVITGIRAYNTRERLKYVQPKLLQYVQNGGTFIVQYNVASGLQTEAVGPYPFSIGRERVSDETAPVSFIHPDHPLLNFPNKITLKDFEDWVQERGLYFASQWDEQYTPLLSSHDPGEPARTGGTLFARCGKGVFIYTGYSWFRQLPAGVPGAFRLFVNMISAGQIYDKESK